ncbi:MAG: HAMP domain-containing histidine kinase, partial [Deltaproteobacteria bacterium]|nr:HAMP domain-containing histidine kinase [Deltaproteobacteria bacterium]
MSRERDRCFPVRPWGRGGLCPLVSLRRPAGSCGRPVGSSDGRGEHPMNSPNSLDDWTTSPVEGEDEAARSLAGLQQELDRTRAQLGMLQLLKRQTMHRVNHDLCTPLVTALGYLEMLVEGRLGKIPARAEARVQVALSNLQRLTRIFDDIVVYNRLLSTEDDRIAPAPVALSLVELLQECAGDFRRAWPGMCFRGEACTWTGPRGGPQRRGSRSRS